MPTEIQKIYDHVLSTLSSNERLQLATLILNSLVQETINVDESGTWTEQDQRDLTTFSLQYAMTSFSDDEEIVE
ncbi:hypothetical protein GFS31_18960 [Leptolyngbya sp. BL0902]|uniref:hypothetical protein n=1 Tax=Leptolyngbya sp. BL0902 TaxID=1115757 RepID=UPI0018E871E4|nr:hypothetical protein [Leptolyngbya sp. BL0902]QQE65210.1 hypothetical protein GFS31_18960 [Leptolyngbya sp. BL0902]